MLQLSELVTERKNDEFRFLHPENWIYHDDIVDKVLKGRYDEITPYSAEFVTTLNCSNRCGFCGYEEAKRKEECWIKNNTTNPRCQMPNLEFAKSQIYRLIDGGVKGIIFTGGGEPFLFPGLEELVGYTTSRKTDVVVYTNGNAVSETRLQRLIETSPLLVRVSLNAGTKQIYNAVHNPLNPECAFGKTVRTMKTLAAGSKQNPVMSLGVSFVINEINKDDLVEAAKRVREAAEFGKIDFITYRPAFNYHALTQLRAELLDKSYETIEKQVRPILENSGITVTNVKCRYEALKHNTRNYVKCRASGLYAELSPPSELHLCCERNCHRDYVIGDLSKQFLKEVYESERRLAALNWINSSHCSSCFLACKPHETNRIFERIEQMRVAGKMIEVKSWIDEERKKLAPKMVNF